MKFRNILTAILIFASLICLEFIGTYAQSEFTDSPSLSDTNALKIHYIDVGQGDSTFIEFPNGKTALIDAGEKEYGNTVINYISKLNYKKIDYVFATHPHSDHIGGLAKVIENFDIGSIYMPNASANTNTYLNLLKVIEAKNQKIKVAVKGKSIAINDDLSLKILAPSGAEYKDLNNYSIVLKLTYKSKSFIFTGDAEYESEMEILSSGVDIKADVLKVGHHGSTSSTNNKFLEKVDPEVAIISVGKNNDYGHPKEKTLEKLTKKNIKIYRTDLNGNIIITTDGEKMKVDVTNGSYS